MEIQNLERRNSEHALFESQHELDSQRQQLLRRITQVFSQVFSKIFYQCQVNSRLVTILTSQVFLIFFMNLVDRDLTEHQITQTLTLSRLDAQLEQTR